MKQSRGDSSLEICITHTIHVIATIRTTKEDTMPACIATMSSPRHGRYLASPSSLGTIEYTLVRLSKAEDENILNILDTKVGTMNEIVNIEKLNDES